MAPLFGASFINIAIVGLDDSVNEDISVARTFA